MHGQVIFDKVKCVNIIQQNFEHHCKFASHVCCQVFSTQALPGKSKFLSNGTAAPVLLFPEEKLYCSIWSKILTGFSSQKESARVQISRGICIPEDRLDRFPAVDQSVSWISRANFVPLRILLSRIPCK